MTAGRPTRPRLRWALLAILLGGLAVALLLERAPQPTLPPRPRPEAPAPPPTAGPPADAPVRTPFAAGCFRTVDEAGRPLADVRAVIALPDCRFLLDADSVGRSDADGVLTLAENTGFAAPQQLLFCNPGYATAATTAREGTIVLERRHVVRGRVVDLSGCPVPGFRVCISHGGMRTEELAGHERIDSGAANDAVMVGLSDDRGEFEVAGLRAGPCALRLFHPDYGVRSCSAFDAPPPFVVPAPFLHVVASAMWRAGVQFVDDEVLQFTCGNLPVAGGVAGASTRHRNPLAVELPATRRELVFHGLPPVHRLDAEELPFALYVLLKRGGPVRLPLAFRPPETARTVQHVTGPTPDGCGRLRVRVLDARGDEVPMQVQALRPGSGPKIPQGTEPASAVPWGVTFATGIWVELPAGGYEIGARGAPLATDSQTMARVAAAQDTTVLLRLAPDVCRIAVRSVGGPLPTVSFRQLDPPVGKQPYTNWCYLHSTADGTATVFAPQALLAVGVWAFGCNAIDLQLDCRGRDRAEVVAPKLTLLD